MPVIIREATLQDIPAIQSVGRAACHDTYFEQLGMTQEYVRDLLNSWWRHEQFAQAIETADELLLVAKEDGSIIGMAQSAYLDAEHAIMWKLYVLREMRGRGVGTALAQGLRTRLCAGTSVLLTEYLTRNTAAGAFYAAQGFEFDHTAEDEFEGEKLSYTYIKRHES